jgi:hypothetical protein
MRPLPHPHHIADDVYGSLPTGIGSSQSPYPAFPGSVDDDVSPALRAEISSFAQRHHDESQTGPHSHLPNNGFHIDPELPSAPAPVTGRGVLVPARLPTVPVSLRDEAAQQASRVPPPDNSQATDIGLFDMAPPPASTHPSWQALHDFAQSHASAHGYALSINTTAKNRSRIKLACVCYGKPKNTHKLTPENRVRKNRLSYKSGCRMWVEGKKHENGSWVLRVGEGVHNHPGRAVEGWSAHRKRTWGVQGGRIGVGGVTAREEQEREQQQGDRHNVMGGNDQRGGQPSDAPQTSKEYWSLESGGLVWSIVEQEMLRKGGPGQGRDRGVGRTVQVLERRLPGIRIFKRDVYNIRAQIKRARKAAGQQIGENLNDSDNEAEGEAIEIEEENHEHQAGRAHEAPGERSYSQIDPMLVAQCNDALRNVTRTLQDVNEVDRLRREVDELRQALSQRTKELVEKSSENDSLRVQVHMANMAMYNQRGGHVHG